MIYIECMQQLEAILTRLTFDTFGDLIASLRVLLRMQEHADHLTVIASGSSAVAQT